MSSIRTRYILFGILLSFCLSWAGASAKPYFLYTVKLSDATALIPVDPADGEDHKAHRAYPVDTLPLTFAFVFSLSHLLTLIIPHMTQVRQLLTCEHSPRSPPFLS